MNCCSSGSSNPRYIPYNPQLDIWSTTSVSDGIILDISGPTVVAPNLSHLPTPDIGDDAAYLYTLQLHILPAIAINTPGSSSTNLQRHPLDAARI